jgi:hypothetical protein
MQWQLVFLHQLPHLSWQELKHVPRCLVTKTLQGHGGWLARMAHLP